MTNFATLARAFITSLLISDIPSVPIENLIIFSVNPNFFFILSGTALWVYTNGAWTKLYTPPKLTALPNSFNVLQKIFEVYKLPPLMKNDINDPKPFAYAFWTKWFGWLGNPG